MPSNERIGRALNSYNLKGDAQHLDIDIVGALAFSSKLGAALQALFSAGHHLQWTSAVELLSCCLMRTARRKRLGISKKDSVIASRQALLEWHVRICKFCNGTGQRLYSYTITGEIEQQSIGDCCAHCEGSGELEPTWAWRKQQMFECCSNDRSEDWWVKRIDLARIIANDAYRSSGKSVSRQLSE